jgi:predicted Rossmann fold flavoprotein
MCYNERGTEKAMEKIGIIGAGPAGITAALQAAHEGSKVFLFDGNDQIGRKLAVTGSGRCNLTNAHLISERYYSDHIPTLKTILEKFGNTHLLQWLYEIGIRTYSTEDGWFYPVSNSAANVVEILSAHLKERGVKIVLGSRVQTLHLSGEIFEISLVGGSEPYRFPRVILASGGMAYPRMGSRGEIFPWVEQMGHTLIPIHPALVPVLTDTRPIHALQGVRLDMGIQLLLGDALLGETYGNAIFNEWGMNGPAVMDLSHWIPFHEPGSLALKINFLPNQPDFLTDVMERFGNSSLPLQAMLGSVLPKKLCQWALKGCLIPENAQINQVPHKDLANLAEWLTAFRLQVKGTKGFDHAQVSSGGVKLEDVFADSMQSRLQKGLYFAGEILNVVGPCGGYNLQWAFSSGMLAGKAAGKF